jgi:cancer susceptibility candidate protein 1
VTPQVHASVLSLLRGQFTASGTGAAPGGAAGGAAGGSAGGAAGGDGLDGQALSLRLCASPESLELVRTTSPLFTATLADTMLALRLFSFS